MVPLLWKNGGANFIDNLRMVIAQGRCFNSLFHYEIMVAKGGSEKIAFKGGSPIKIKIL
jgi:hypothetical protein